MQNKKHKPIPRFPITCDPFYWSLWDEQHPDFVVIGNLHAQGLNETRKCPHCNSSTLTPKSFGSLDVGYQLIYSCPCKKMQVRFWTEGYEYAE